MTMLLSRRLCYRCGRPSMKCFSRSRNHVPLRNEPGRCQLLRLSNPCLLMVRVWYPFRICIVSISFPCPGFRFGNPKHSCPRIGDLVPSLWERLSNHHFDLDELRHLSCDAVCNQSCSLSVSRLTNDARLSTLRVISLDHSPVRLAPLTICS